MIGANFDAWQPSKDLDAKEASISSWQTISPNMQTESADMHKFSLVQLITPGIIWLMWQSTLSLLLTLCGKWSCNNDLSSSFFQQTTFHVQLHSEVRTDQRLGRQACSGVTATTTFLFFRMKPQKLNSKELMVGRNYSKEKGSDCLSQNFESLKRK